MKLIYVVEDHDVIRDGVVQYLSLSGYDAKGFGTIAGAREAFSSAVPDLLIQDVMLPDGDGFSFAKEMKEAYPRLVLRIQALFRRIDDTSTSTDKVYTYRDEDNVMVIDDNEHVLTINGTPVTLTAAEWRIVFFLASNTPNLITRSQILEECFDYNFESYERVVDTHIKNIRAKLKPGSWIDTVRGYGYRFSGKKA